MKNTPFILIGSFNVAFLFSLAASAQNTVGDVRADSPAGIFGDQGQLVISSDAGLSISNTSLSGVEDSTTQIVLRPAIDYFVVDYLSLGGFVGVEHTSTGGFNSTAFSIGPRVGYDIPLSNRVSLWPKVGFSFARTSVDVDVDVPGPDPEADATNSTVQLNLYVPFLFQPVDHFFLGFGPALDVDLTGDAKATTIAGRLTLGGWM